jgi:hypothetical protein
MALSHRERALAVKTIGRSSFFPLDVANIEAASTHRKRLIMARSQTRRLPRAEPALRQR